MAPGLYLHVPFCSSICPYCDFSVVHSSSPARQRFTSRLVAEVALAAPAWLDPRPFDTVYFGGGTPSLLSPLQFASVFKSLRASFDLTPDCEITIEANPGTVSYESLVQLREIGINRISFGVQSANAFELRMLERAHNFLDVIEAVDGRIELDRVCVLGLDTCSDDAKCALHDVWKLFRQNYASTLASMTLRDAANVLKSKRTLGAAPNIRVVAEQ